jgi:hypothetical protein
MQHGNTARYEARIYGTICGTEMRHGNTAQYEARKYGIIWGTEIRHNMRHGNTA